MTHLLDGAVVLLVVGLVGFALRLRHEAAEYRRACVTRRLDWLVCDLPADTDARLAAQDREAA